LAILPRTLISIITPMSTGDLMNNSFVFVSSVLPYPVDSGKKVFIDGLLRYMIDRFGALNVHYFIVGKYQSSDIDYFNKKYKINVHYLGSVSVNDILISLLVNVFRRFPKSFQECLLYSKKIETALFDKISSIDPDIAVLDTIRLGQYFETKKPTAGNYVLYLEDLFSVRYQRMLEASLGNREGTLNAAGNFISNIPLVFRGLLRFPLLEKLILSIELKRVSQRERYLPERFDLNLLLNSDDVSELKKNASILNVRQISPLIKMNSLLRRQWDGEPQFVFIGDLNVSENAISLEIFFEKCIERLIIKSPDFKLFIIGKGITKNLQDYVNRYPENLKYKGYVPDLDDIFFKCAGMIIPMLFGSGIRFKALDAFLRGVPVISTPLGVEGLGLENRDICLIAKTIELMPEFIEKVLDPQVNLELSKKGRVFFEENFDYGLIRNLYDSLFVF